MQITRTGVIATLPALQAREVLREMGFGHFTQSELATLIRKVCGASVDPERAAQTLIAEGFVHDQGFGLAIAPLGSSLHSAMASKPVKRTTAESALAGFLERIQQANNNPDFTYSVNKAIVFGSYLSSKDRLGDVDVAVELVGKIMEQESQSEANLKRARASGRRFSSTLDMLLWANHEVKLFLKGRSRVLQLTEINNPAVTSGPHEVIFQA